MRPPRVPLMAAPRLNTFLRLSRTRLFLPRFRFVLLTLFSMFAGDVGQLQLPASMQKLWLNSTSVSGTSKNCTKSNDLFLPHKLMAFGLRLRPQSFFIPFTFSPLSFRPLFLPHPSSFFFPLPSYPKTTPPSSLFHPYFSPCEPPRRVLTASIVCAPCVLLPFPPLCGTQPPSLMNDLRQAPCLGKKQGENISRSLKTKQVNRTHLCATAAAVKC